MTQKKTIADSLLFMLTHPVAIAALDLTNDIRPAIDEVSSWWSYDLFKRKPGPAYYDEEGNFHATDLDLACFLYELAKRGSVINLPEYKAKKAKRIREDQQIVSQYNRHGKIVGLNSNKDFFSFSIKIIDENVIGEDKVGDFRNFMLTNYTGRWYDGWKEIEFVSTMNENKWLIENKLLTGNKIYFRNFVAPNRWTSFFGHHYALTKILLDRLDDESRYYASQIKAMQDSGIKFPEWGGPAPSFPYDKEKGVWRKFPAVEVRVQYPDITGQYPKYEFNQENMIELYRRRKHFVYTLAPRLRFMTRATELAHSQNPDRMPFWIKGGKWESGYKLPRGRIEWNRLVLFQPEVGKPAVSLLKRNYEKSIEVAE